MDEASESHLSPRWRTLILICVGVTCILTTWFSATAIIPEIQSRWGFTDSEATWLTNAVQIGFVTGAVGSSFVNLPDLVQMNRMVAVSAMLAAAANAILLFEPGLAISVFARFLTGLALAGVYPPALKLMSTWFVRGRGLALGFLIGALTLGSSLPHLTRALTAGADWQVVVTSSSLLTLAGAAIFAFLLREGPHPFGRAVFNPKKALSVFTSKPLFLANLGYFGHMWELYAMWAWILAFAAAAEAGLSPFPFGSASMLSFVAVSSGATGCLLGGWLADRIGRCLTTAGMMAVSASCAALIGLSFAGPAWLLGLIVIIWGISIVGDSAQFSASITELADQSFVGTALALQLGIGFALTVVAIWALPLFVALIGGWQWAFLILVPGPVIGAIAMLTLRAQPEARAIAGGRR